MQKKCKATCLNGLENFSIRKDAANEDFQGFLQVFKEDTINRAPLGKSNLDH